MGRSRRGVSAALVALALVALLASCGGSKGQVVEQVARNGAVEESLAQLIRRLAGQQGVEESAVAAALRDAARSSSTDELAIARQWDNTLPAAQPLPNLTERLSHVLEQADPNFEKLQGAVCSAVLDIIRTNQVPSPQEFAQNYLTGLLPGSSVQAAYDTFADLYDAAAVGNQSSAQTRLLLMKYQYC